MLAHYPLSSVLPKAILSFLPEWLADGRVIHLAGFEWAAVQGNLAILWIGAYVAYYFALSPRGAVSKFFVHHHDTFVLLPLFTLLSGSAHLPANRSHLLLYCHPHGELVCLPRRHEDSLDCPCYLMDRPVHWTWSRGRKSACAIG